MYLFKAVFSAVKRQLDSTTFEYITFDTYRKSVVASCLLRKTSAASPPVNQPNPIQPATALSLTRYRRLTLWHALLSSVYIVSRAILRSWSRVRHKPPCGVIGSRLVSPPLCLDCGQSLPAPCLIPTRHRLLSLHPGVAILALLLPPRGPQRLHPPPPLHRVRHAAMHA